MPSKTPVALVTGAAHRLGAQTARTLHARGWNLVVHYRSREEQAKPGWIHPLSGQFWTRPPWPAPAIPMILLKPLRS